MNGETVSPKLVIQVIFNTLYFLALAIVFTKYIIIDLKLKTWFWRMYSLLELGGFKLLPDENKTKEF